MNTKSEEAKEKLRALGKMTDNEISQLVQMADQYLKNKKAIEVLESFGTNEGMLYYHTHGQGLLAGAPRCRQRGETRKVYFPGLTDLSLPLVLFHRFWFITGIALDYNIIVPAVRSNLTNIPIFFCGT